MARREQFWPRHTTFYGFTGLLVRRDYLARTIQPADNATRHGACFR